MMIDLELFLFRYKALAVFLVAFAASVMVFNPILEIAKRKGIIDCPDFRKWQRAPVPVLGGVAVFFGIVVGLSFFKTESWCVSIIPLLCAMAISLYVGCCDDILVIKPWKRMLIEIIEALIVINGTGILVDDFHGMWGVCALPQYVSVPLSVLTFVGVVNAINMIDGIDGLASALCIFVCSLFAVVFYLGHNIPFAMLAVVCVGAVTPFFFHNVFGLRTKMFLGDGGTMLIGTIIATMVMMTLHHSFSFSNCPGADFSRIAMVVAILSIPVADTLRVMFVRMAKGRSPFSPDRTHFHHYFVDAGFSHFSIVLIEVSLNFLVVAVFAASWLLGVSAEWQLYIVILTAALFDFGTAALLRGYTRKGGRIPASSPKQRKLLRLMQRLVDGKYNYTEQ